MCSVACVSLGTEEGAEEEEPGESEGGRQGQGEEGEAAAAATTASATAPTSTAVEPSVRSLHLKTAPSPLSSLGPAAAAVAAAVERAESSRAGPGVEGRETVVEVAVTPLFSFFSSVAAEEEKTKPLIIYSFIFERGGEREREEVEKKKTFSISRNRS